ncbi:MAG: molybdopterin-dependent oxidoreductase [Frankiales bacterium]|jgi:formate dehydrogenase major subunit|nr:molybdopterin-dependent oxidoreductase [Frankiales bacterium]
MAECHPVGFQWVMEAKARGAKVIHIDPRFTRTSAHADQHVPIRAGSDIVFLGALIKYILDNEKYFREYVVAYTNAATLVGEDFQDVDEHDGLFSGYDPETGTYDTASWSYAGHADDGEKEESEHSQRERGAGHELGGRGANLESAEVQRDETLQHPQTVFQVLKRHYARYTPELVQEVCGVPPEAFLEVAEAVTSNSGRERTTAWVYSVGWTQHSVGVQYIRGAAIIQLLLGNMGRPGGGILALRGHASIQGSTDIPTLYNLLPGYLPMPKAGEHDDFEAYLDSVRNKDQKGFWTQADAYTVSLLKAWFGQAATAENGYGFDWLPRISGDHGTYRTVLDMLDDKVEGYFLLGQNPAVGSAQGKIQRLAMSHLKWLVVRDLNLIESATFWKDAPEIATGELRTEDIGTEVFFFPAAAHTEKEGTFTQTQRMLQWRHKAIEPEFDRRSELHFIFNLGRIAKQRLAGSTLERDRAIQAMTWDYPVEHGTEEPSGRAILREINGFHLTGERAGELLDGFTDMRADGSTSGGCWIYSGVYAGNVNRAERRTPLQESQWGWAWPMDRRVLYNRASADPQGRPWSERKALVWWDEEQGKWVGHDVPDFQLTKPPGYRPEPGSTGPDALAGDDPFIMQADGKGWLYAPTGLLDGPLPSHYEPHESPVKNALYGQQTNPTRMVYRRKENLSNPSAGEPGAEVFPYVFTTYRLTEHHTAGGMSRWLPYLAELQPEMFAEVSPELAAEQGLEHLGYATIVTARTAIEARVLVTDRMAPLRIGEKTVHQIGLPYHWGQGDQAYVTGDSANDLFVLSLDPNVFIQECKAASCDIQPGRRPTGPALLDYVEEYRRRAGITTETGNRLLTRDDP